MRFSALPLLPAALLAGLMGPAGPAFSQSAPEDTAVAATSPASETLWVHAERLILRPGVVLEDAALLVENGRILAIGKGLARPEGARSLEGRVVCASFMDPWSSLALDAGSMSDDETDPATRTSDALALDEQPDLCRDAVASGVTLARVQAGLYAPAGGFGVVLRLAPELADAERLVSENACSAAALGIEMRARAYDVFDRLGMVDKLVDRLEAGRKYDEDWVEYRYEIEEWQKAIAEKEKELDKDAKKAKKDREKEEAEAKEKGKEFKEKSYKEDKKPKPPKFDAERAALAEVANGAVPLFVYAEGAAEIRALLEATASQDRLRMVLVGASEALPFAKELAARHIPVLLAPLPASVRAQGEHGGADLSLAAKLAAAGVEILLGSGGVEGATRDLPLLIALAIGHGLDPEHALAAVTTNAADALDLGQRFGSLETGKEAELLVLDGEPFALGTQVRYVVTGGRVLVQPEK